ncbi:hypothetical protein AB0B04_18950 [Streptomyces xinghaiensis]|uniref:Uncharacterized protein n=2 Tax=Streptomyces TaxID=1883 RepID=A0A420UXZ6_9ACTN|nr:MULTISPECIES: hypothetical protein [Streptomyces]KNE83286.1 hypothetical protein ADZ36_05435 [Streptomyces fradiae]OFA36642.1 hypothetical protein BEN35_29745 [Streptomyces fradiae]PQM20639.1 hypothetical protein Sfr7A_25990 [Streptomyces xinghaiensis]RKM92580.1 hypothetical protein SFRA_024645 [Streptomyces xinghaiensis]RNC70548.1 hypothetical protein DC095_025635 [Streptomyces xinghaiensis]
MNTLNTLVIPGYRGPRTRAADFFNGAHTAHTRIVLPPLTDGDCLSCPDGYLWVRQDGRWVLPGQADAVCVDDATVAAWWERHRFRPGTRFALVHRLTPHELHRISARCYLRAFTGLSTQQGAFIHREVVTGARLFGQAAQVIQCRSASVHLEMPSGIITFHSRLVGDVFHRPL